MVKQKKIKIILSLFILGLFLVPLNFSLAQEASPEYPDLCAVYLTGIGCGNCAVADPLIFSEIPAEYNNFVVIEYEIYKSSAANREVSTEYFKNYLAGTRPGVPLFILDKDRKALGRMQVMKAKELLGKKETNPCPLPSGQSKEFKNLDLSSLAGEIKVWYKDRVLISDGKRNDSKKLKELLLADNPDLIIEKNNIKRVEPKKVLISGGKISFKKAVNLDGWLLQWQQDKIVRDKPVAKQIKKPVKPQVAPDTRKVLIDHILFLKKEIKTKNLYMGLEALIIALLLVALFRNKIKLLLSKDKRTLKNFIIISSSLLALVFIFILVKDISPNLLRNFSNKAPFPVFTFFIALVDGFNPCNLFVLTLLLALLISASGSKRRVYLVGFIFIFVVFLFYFLFMAAWLNIFKYFGLFTSLRMIIGSVAILAGLINCKDYFFFKKGISLTIGEKQKGVLAKKMNQLRKVVEGGSLWMLILSSLGLAIFSSFVELPCTAGFPIIFTTVLASRTAIATSSYYLWILLYNLIYILPLILIVAIFGYTFKAGRISQRQIKIIKLIGGVIMVVLGLILIINPQLVGIGLQ